MCPAGAHDGKCSPARHAFDLGFGSLDGHKRMQVHAIAKSLSVVSCVSGVHLHAGCVLFGDLGHFGVMVCCARGKGREKSTTWRLTFCRPVKVAASLAATSFCICFSQSFTPAGKGSEQQATELDLGLPLTCDFGTWPRFW